MKSILKNILSLTAAAACAATFCACDDDTPAVDFTIYPGNELYLPADGAKVDLTKGRTTQFEWSSSVAADKGFVSYDVLFAPADGDFSSPTSTLPGQLTGSKTYLTLSAKELNKVAKAAGIPLGETGELRWTVRASKGLFGSIYSASRSLTVTRLRSVDPQPETVLIGGPAAEDAAGIRMLARKDFNGSSVEAGYFDCFTRLTEGEFTVSDDQNRYYRLESDGRITDSETPVANTLSAAGIYRLSIDFEGMTWSATAVSKVELYAAAWSDGMHTAREEMTYKGKGVWELLDYDNTTSDNAAKDSRHRFDMHLADGSTLYLGTTASLGSSYTTDYLKVFLFDSEGIGNADWDRTWNFLSTDCGRPLDCYLYMNADNQAGTYWHEYRFK